MSLADHRPHRFYRACGHSHKRNEFGTVAVPDLGQVCAVGLVYTVCAACCVVEGTRSAVCLNTHAGTCIPCPRRFAAERSLREAGKLVPVEYRPELYGVAR